MKVPSVVKKFAKHFIDNNFQIFLVGGAIRNQLLHIGGNDYDFATNALPTEVQKIFHTVIPVGIKHGTVIVVFEGHSFEVTTFRSEANYSDNRRPDSVKFESDIEEDLKRRDFTINALAWDIKNKVLIDNYNGQKDLSAKIIRAIGNPIKRFEEDALRMLRACRFASALNFVIEESTLNAIKNIANLIQKISAERIRDELIKIMSAEKPSIALEYLRETGLMHYILPELEEGFGIKQNRFHKYTVYYHNIYSCDAAPSDNYIIRFAALLHDIAKPQTKREKSDENSEDENSFYNHEVIGAKIAYKILRRLKFKRDDINKITHLIRHHMFFYTTEWTDGAVRRFIKNVEVKNLEDLFLLREADRQGNGTKVGTPKIFLDFQDRIAKIMEIDSAFKVKDLNISGTVIMEELNISPGPLIGEILNHLLDFVLDDPEMNKQDSLLEEASRYYTTKREYSLKEFGEIPENLGKF